MGEGLYLKYLELNNNQLATLPELVFAGLASLKGLNLSSNQLATLPERVFAGLKSLKELDLRSNPFRCPLPPVCDGGGGFKCPSSCVPNDDEVFDDDAWMTRLRGAK